MCYFKSHLTDEEHHRVSSANFKPLFGQSTNACRALRLPAGLSSLCVPLGEDKALGTTGRKTFVAAPNL